MHELPSTLLIRTLPLKVRSESYAWLNKAAIEVNTVWNWANEISAKAACPFAGRPRFLTGFDLNNLSAGAAGYFDWIGAATIQRVNCEHARNRVQAKRVQLRWRASRGARKALGWVPFRSASLKRRARALRFGGKTFRVFDAGRLEGVRWRDGCFAQDSVGDWWLCIPIRVLPKSGLAPHPAVGIDLGLKDLAVTSDGHRFGAPRFYRALEPKVATAQRRGHKRQAKRLYRRAANRRRDTLHKFSRMIVDRYQNIFVGDVSSIRLARTRMASAVLDASWGMLKAQLQYKGEYAGSYVTVVSERHTSRVCSSCGCNTGPRGLRQLAVRWWECSACGAEHDRDVNAAKNILAAGLRCRASVSGNEPMYPLGVSRSDFGVREARPMKQSA